MDWFAMQKQRMLDEQQHNKYLPFRLSCMAFLTPLHVHENALLVTGSWLEERNRLSLWKYGAGKELDSNRLVPHSEMEDGLTTGVIGDSTDEPRLLSSVVAKGSIQCLQMSFMGTSDGAVGAYKVTEIEAGQTDSVSQVLDRVNDGDWRPFDNARKPVSALAASTDASRLITASDDGSLSVISVDRSPKSVGAIVDRGADSSGVNALERVDSFCFASCNQLGQLKLWDLRKPLGKSVAGCLRALRPGAPLPLLCLARHPGQPNLLATGGISSSSSAVYLWDLRSDQHPMVELPCPGATAAWTLRFHPRRPSSLFVGTFGASLLSLNCCGENEWQSNSETKRRLTVEPMIPENERRPDDSVIAFDVNDSRVACCGDDSILRTICIDVPTF